MGGGFEVVFSDSTVVVGGGVVEVVVVSLAAGELVVNVRTGRFSLNGGNPFFLFLISYFFVNFLLRSLLSLRLCELSASVGGLKGLGYIEGACSLEDGKVVDKVISKSGDKVVGRAFTGEKARWWLRRGGGGRRKGGRRSWTD